MVATRSTRNHSLPGPTLGIIVLTLALALGAVAGFAAFNLGLAKLAGGVGGPPVLRPVTSVPAPPTSPSPTPDPTVAPTASPTPAPTLAPSATPVTVSDGKVIVVSLATQNLTAYQDGAVVFSTVVATGRPALATPRGTFHVMAKYTPYSSFRPGPKAIPTGIRLSGSPTPCSSPTTATSFTTRPGGPSTGRART